MDYTDRVAEAIQHFWRVRAKQYMKQGSETGVKDYGTRGAVTGGKHLDGFVALLAQLLSEAGITRLHDSQAWNNGTGIF